MSSAFSRLRASTRLVNRSFSSDNSWTVGDGGGSVEAEALFDGPDMVFGFKGRERSDWGAVGFCCLLRGRRWPQQPRPTAFENRRDRPRVIELQNPNDLIKETTFPFPCFDQAPRSSLASVPPPHNLIPFPRIKHPIHCPQSLPNLHSHSLPESSSTHYPTPTPPRPHLTLSAVFP